MSTPTIDLIINADDFGYFKCVSEGIVQAAVAGVVGATGIMANAPGLDAQLPSLDRCAKLDLGVHLNLSLGVPLSGEMARSLAAFGGIFPDVFAMTAHILSRRIGLDAVEAEWRCQIKQLLERGLVLRFVNSHEHLHMLPGLFSLACRLAAEYGIPQVRLTRAEWWPPKDFKANVRNGLVQGMVWAAMRHASPKTPIFIGLGRSGRLDVDYLRQLFAKLRPGRSYELMCHPGQFDPAEITDPKLLGYHAWQDELAALTSPEIEALCEQFGIRLVNYRGMPLVSKCQADG